MGILRNKPQVEPQRQLSITPLDCSNLLSYQGDISRANFKFIKRLKINESQTSCILWLASNKNNCKQLYFIRQFNKEKVYNNQKIESVLTQLYLLTTIKNPFLIKTYFAFQDYESLYLVTQAIDSVPLSLLLDHHTFTSEESKYTALALTSLIEEVHNLGYAFTELSPEHIYFNKKTGQLKLIQISNPAKIDAHYTSTSVLKICKYSAPEILCRDKVLAECDYYSLGLIIYQMMAQSKAFALDQNQNLTRNQLLKHILQVQKSQVPQDWQSQAADFLIKVLIKNPKLRLGRYGAFQIKSHPWLQGFNIDEYSKKGINISQMELSNIPKLQVSQQIEKEESKLINNHFFQIKFSKYRYRRQSVEQEEQIIQSQMISAEKTSVLFNESHLKLKNSRN